MAFSKSSIIKCSGLLIILALSAVVTLILCLSSAQALKGLLAALAVTALAGGLALIPVFYAVSYKPDLTQTLSLAAGGIRLLLTLAGSAAVCLLININVLWFIGWTAVFYLIILVVEICIAIKAMDLNNISGAAQS